MFKIFKSEVRVLIQHYYLRMESITEPVEKDYSNWFSDFHVWQYKRTDDAEQSRLPKDVSSKIKNPTFNISYKLVCSQFTKIEFASRLPSRIWQCLHVFQHSVYADALDVNGMILYLNAQFLFYLFHTCRSPLYSGHWCLFYKLPRFK